MRLIDADALHEALRKKPKWVVHRENRHNEGYTYDQVHFAIDEAPTIEAIPVEWIKKYEKYDDLAASIYRMLEAWGADLSEWEEL